MFKKPNTQGITDAGIAVISMVAGAKISDGVASIVPESIAPYKGYILGVLGIVGAACVSGSTTASKAAQGVLLGMGAKQIYNEVTETAKESVAARVGTTSTDKFVNALVGHGVKGLGEPNIEHYANMYNPMQLSAPWEETPQEVYNPQVLSMSAAM